MKHALNDNTVDEKLTNAETYLANTAKALDEVLTALNAIMPCLPGEAPLKAEHAKLKNVEKWVVRANDRLGRIRELLSDDALLNMKKIDRAS